MREALLVHRRFTSLIRWIRDGATSPAPPVAVPENALRILGAWEGPRPRSPAWVLNLLAIGAISLYRTAVSRGMVLQACCLHYPSCSGYAILAFRRHRFMQALRLTRSRVADCGSSSGRPFVDFP